MCGLYGWAINRHASRMMGPGYRKLLAWILASEMVERGDDSHGYYLPLSDKLYRRVGSALDTVADFSSHRVLMGHTRAATHGAVTIANAHPFDLGGIVGAHNGIIHNTSELDRKHAKAEVDSLHVLRALACEDKDAIVKRAKECEGYAALTWVGRKHSVWNSAGGVYCLRASEGSSLECARLERGDSVYGSVWASTRYALELALRATWDRLPGCKHVLIELPVGHVTCAKDTGLWTVPQAPEIRTGSYQSYFYSRRSHGSWVDMGSGCKVWRSYTDQMEQAEMEYNTTGDESALHRWMQLEAQLERDNEIGDMTGLGDGWPCD